MRTRNASDAKLKRIYRRLNRQWFGRKLSDDVVVRWTHLDKHTQAEATTPQLLQFDAALKKWPRTLEFAMVHEMTHIELWDVDEDHHGDRWQARMLELAIAGAFRYLW